MNKGFTKDLPRIYQGWLSNTDGSQPSKLLTQGSTNGCTKLRYTPIESQPSINKASTKDSQRMALNQGWFLNPAAAPPPAQQAGGWVIFV